jgi:hypothetical protein
MNGLFTQICLRGKVFIEPFPSNGSVRHNIIPIHCNAKYWGFQVREADTSRTYRTHDKEEKYVKKILGEI